MLSVLALILAALILAPLGAQAADLVVWWQKGYYDQEDDAIRETIAAFEQETGKQVELVRHDLDQQTAVVQAAIDAGRPPDFLFGQLAEHQIPRWAEEGRLVDLTDIIGPLKDLFDPDTLEFSTLRNGRDGRTALYALPMARDTTHVHVWKSLLEQAGLTLDDIPTEWDTFWTFWGDRAQPAVRKALGRDDVWGTGLPRSARAIDTRVSYTQFQVAYVAWWEGTVRAYHSGGREFAAWSSPTTLIAGDQHWQIDEGALVGPDGTRLPRLPGHIAYWFAWQGFIDGAPLAEPNEVRSVR